jgi:hypothetical protein
MLVRDAEVEKSTTSSMTDDAAEDERSSSSMSSSDEERAAHGCVVCRWGGGCCGCANTGAGCRKGEEDGRSGTPNADSCGAGNSSCGFCFARGEDERDRAAIESDSCRRFGEGGRAPPLDGSGGARFDIAAGVNICSAETCLDNFYLCTSCRSVKNNVVPQEADELSTECHAV